MQERQQEFRAERPSAIQAVSPVITIRAYGPVPFLVVLLALTFSYSEVLLMAENQAFT